MTNDTHFGPRRGGVDAQRRPGALRRQGAARRLVWINCQFVSDPSMPGGGFKQSGWGRELGEEGLNAYLETKSVFAAL